MKTSNKLVIAALLFLLVSLVVYDYKLKEAYSSGSYKNPYREFINLKFKNFDAVDVVSSTAANVKFIQGPFKVMIDTNTLQFVRIKQKGRRLEVKVNFEYEYLYNPNPYIIVISCPKLLELNADARYTTNGKQVIDTVVREEWNMRQVLIDGFKQDSLSIRQDYGSTVVLSGNTINSVYAVSGESEGSGSKLVILKNNHLHNATINILQKSTFVLQQAEIQNLNYHITDSARMITSGAVKNLLNLTPKPQTK